MTTIILSEWNKYEFYKPSDKQTFQSICKIDPIKLCALNQCKYSKKYTLSNELLDEINTQIKTNINDYHIIDIIAPSNYIKYILFERTMEKTNTDVGITVNMLCNDKTYLNELMDKFSTI